MAALVQAEASNQINAMFGTATYTAPTGAIKVALITTATPSTAAALGSEVSGGSYARQTVTMSTSTSGGSVNNSGVLTFTNMPAATVGGVDFLDSAGTPVRKAFGTLTANKTTNSGDTFSFAVSSLTYAQA